jgi:hypothetical protein
MKTVKNEAMVMLPAGLAISGPVHPSPFSVVPDLPAIGEREDWDTLERIRETLVAKEKQLTVFAERAEIEAAEAHAKAICLARQLRLAKAALAALEGF